MQNNDEKISQIKELHDLNSQILDRLSDLSNNETSSLRAYIANTRLVARHRLDIISAVLPQLDKNPNKVNKVQKRVLSEINFGDSIDALTQQAKDELIKMEKMK